MKLTAIRVLLYILASISAISVSAHDLRYIVTDEHAVVVSLFFSEKHLFSYQSYEIFAPDNKIPVQVGRTDAAGRVVFLPDRSGVWRIKSFTEDGHGVDFTLDIGADRLVEHVTLPWFERYMRIFTGIGFILGVFGLWSLFYARQNSPKTKEGIKVCYD
jgi:nickel transport protein